MTELRVVAAADIALVPRCACGVNGCDNPARLRITCDADGDVEPTIDLCDDHAAPLHEAALKAGRAHTRLRTLQRRGARDRFFRLTFVVYATATAAAGCAVVGGWLVLAWSRSHDTLAPGWAAIAIDQGLDAVAAGMIACIVLSLIARIVEAWS